MAIIHDRMDEGKENPMSIMSIPREPQIAINGLALTTAEAMTVRVAIESLATSLMTDGLGDDEAGIAMVAGYLAAIEKIRQRMYP